jgi:hypothetical protein
MYVEFPLPNGSAGQAAAHTLLLIRKGVVDWAIKHSVAYTEKTIKYTHRVCFADDSMCNFFALSYDGMGKFRIVDPLNNLT